jgi:hypothetical protein
MVPFPKTRKLFAPNLVKPLKSPNSAQPAHPKPDIFIANMSQLPYAIRYNESGGSKTGEPSSPGIPPLSPLEEIF